jgi:Polyketide cyclase / dehydrase and lipid transport
MQIKLPFDPNQPVTGESSIVIDEPQGVVFSFIAENYFDNYQKWAPEVIEVEPLTEKKVIVGTKGKQIREDNGETVESIFEVTEFSPHSRFVLQGLSPRYQSTYVTEANDQSDQTKLTFRFDLLEIELFMRPFVKLIRAAIEEGAENTVSKIKELIAEQNACTASK